MNSNLTNTRNPVQVWIGFLAFLFPFSSLVTQSGVSVGSFLFLITALILFKPCRTELARHWPQVRWVVLAFLLHFLFVLGCALVRGANMNTVDKPSRMFFAVSALAAVLAARPPRRMLWWGVIGGALAALPVVAWQRIAMGIDRPGGLINAITFGDLALLLALLAVTAAIDMRKEPHQARLAGLGAIAGLAASLLTGSRGGWVALAVAGLLFLRHARGLKGSHVRVLLASGAAVVLVAWFVPATEMQARFDEGVGDVRTWVGGGNVNTRVGTRLELWKGASMLIAEHPLLGMDFQACRARLAEFAREGKLDPVVLPLPHLHNDALQELATGGVAGFALWAAILAAPLLFFARQLRAGAGSPQFAVALAGVLVVTSYVCFGLTEVIFWSMKGSLFYALMVFVLMGFCLNAKEKIG
ncbi:O-antigen ligase family protein [Massilia sp. LXY-6]|uniref:O-antigen ligase family protein n=1 Tax=Massilia sp. LXY-6 TaxID=3379823 RepID=UPI003EE2A6DD